jgi:hypothetical protein
MPFNLLKVYNAHLELAAMNEIQKHRSLRAVFDKDFLNEQVTFRNRNVTPTPADGVINMDLLYRHLTTVVVDPGTKRREFEHERSCRLHWVRHHIDCRKGDNMLIFSMDEPEGIRTYIYDKDERYVIVLEPKKNNAYYLITAYHLTGKDFKRDKIMKKYGRRLDEIH